jgi:hypothetical protein
MNHGYDQFWIWLNPVWPYYVPSTASGVAGITVLGVGSDKRDPVTAQASQPDVVALSVIQLQNLIAVLNANETPTPANTGITSGDLQSLQRTWDTTWSNNSGGEAGPGLVAADYQDILNADPWVASPSFNPGSSTRFALVSSAYILYGATSSPDEYQYQGQATSANSQSSGTDDQHTVSTEVSITIGNLNAQPVGANAKLDYAGKWLWDTKSMATTTNTSTQTATFNVWTPSLNYTGPPNIAVYWDTVYQVFAFYPD